MDLNFSAWIFPKRKMFSAQNFYSSILCSLHQCAILVSDLHGINYASYFSTTLSTPSFSWIYFNLSLHPPSCSLIYVYFPRRKKSVQGIILLNVLLPHLKRLNFILEFTINHVFLFLSFFWTGVRLYFILRLKMFSRINVQSINNFASLKSHCLLGGKLLCEWVWHVLMC